MSNLTHQRLEYAIANSEISLDEQELLWSENYAGMRAKVRRKNRNNDFESVIVTRTVSATQPYVTEPSYDLELLTRNLITNFHDLDILSKEDMDEDELYDVVETYALALMPVFAEALARHVVSNANEVYGNPENTPAMTKRERDKQLDNEQQLSVRIRNLGGVPGWSAAPGTPPIKGI